MNEDFFFFFKSARSFFIFFPEKLYFHCKICSSYLGVSSVNLVWGWGNTHSAPLFPLSVRHNESFSRWQRFDKC